MTTANSRAEGEAQIRALMDDRVNAVRAKDVNVAMSSIAPDIQSFDVVGPLQRFGSDALTRAEEWFSSFQGPIGYKMRELNTRAMTSPLPMASAMLAQRRQAEDYSICGGVRLWASASLTASGSSRTSITPCLST